jgi:cytochrome c peroxidase
MLPIKSKKLAIICRTLLGASFVYSSAFAQSLNPGPTPPPTPGPTPIPHSFPTPTPNPGASPASGVQPGGVAIPVPVLNMAQYLPGGANFGKDPDIPILLNRIQQNYTQALNQLTTANGPAQFTQALGKALIYDQNLSVNNNLACATCHIDYSGFTGGSSFFNSTTSADPGSVPITNAPVVNGQLTGPNERISSRRPQTYAYAPYSPVLHYNNTVQDFYGGNFWDMRAGGIRLGNPAAEQAQGPPTNPVEMGNLDIATYIYKLSLTPEAKFFEIFWGKGTLSSIKWPPGIAQLAATPGPGPANNPDPVLTMLSNADQNLVISDFDRAAQSTAAYEAGPEVSPFSSKFDYALANPTQQVLSADELAGWNLFRSKAHCNTCHLDGTENVNKSHITPADAADVAPLFTDFTSANIGTPQNYALPFLYENKPDQFGYVANAAGLMYLDLGVGAFLANVALPVVLGESQNHVGTGRNPDPAWAILAPNFNGKVQTPTLRNVDLRPYTAFVKAYSHNGYFKSLKAIVHFYNTRDTLNGGVHLPPGEPGEGITYWPWPEANVNVDQTIGHLGLTDAEENQIVAFLQTLTDGFFVPPIKFNSNKVPTAQIPPRFLQKMRQQGMAAQP